VREEHRSDDKPLLRNCDSHRTNSRPTATGREVTTNQNGRSGSQLVHHVEGAGEYVAIPINTEDLIEAVRRLLGKGAEVAPDSAISSGASGSQIGRIKIALQLGEPLAHVRNHS
jgi:hypothetical protein